MSVGHIADAEPIECLDNFHVYREQDYPDFKKELYKPIYDAIVYLWKAKGPISLRVPLRGMKPPEAQKKAHNFAERHGFAIDTRRAGEALWIRRSQKPRDQK